MKRTIYALLIAAIILIIGYGVKSSMEKKYTEESTKVAKAFLDQYVKMDELAMSTYVYKDISTDWAKKLYERIPEYATYDVTFAYQIEETAIFKKPFNELTFNKMGVNKDKFDYVAEFTVTITVTEYGENYSRTIYLYAGRSDKEWKIIYQSGL